MGLVNLNLWVTLYLRPGADADFVIQELESLDDIVDVVESIFEAHEPPRIYESSYRQLQLGTPDWEHCQGYLTPAPEGIDAEFMWKIGISGSGVKVYDVEYGWHQTHEDLLLNVPVLVEGTVIFQYRDHGTAVLGEMVARPSNELGMKGICF